MIIAIIFLWMNEFLPLLIFSMSKTCFFHLEKPWKTHGKNHPLEDFCQPWEWHVRVYVGCRSDVPWGEWIGIWGRHTVESSGGNFQLSSWQSPSGNRCISTPSSVSSPSQRQFTNNQSCVHVVISSCFCHNSYYLLITGYFMLLVIWIIDY